MLRPSRRGGVPVFRRPTRKRQFTQALGKTVRRRITGTAALVIFKTDMYAGRPKKYPP